MGKGKDLWVGPYDDARVFPMIRTYIKEVLTPTWEPVLVPYIDEIFSDERLKLVRKVGIKSYLSWVCNANLYHLRKGLK